MKTLNKTRLRRSMLFVPGANAAMVSNAFIYQADALMFDLEDSVILREKDAARRLVYHALQHPLYQEVETIVRVNALDSAYGLADLQAVVRGGGFLIIFHCKNAHEWIDVVDLNWRDIGTKDWLWWTKPRPYLEIRQPEPKHPLCNLIPVADMSWHWFGAFDLLDNVGEWTADSYCPDGAPFDPSRCGAVGPKASPRGADFEFVDDIFGGAIPRQFVPAVEKGIQDARSRGYLAGYPMVDFRVTVFDGAYHDVDSNELSFKLAGSLAFKDAMTRARPTRSEAPLQTRVNPASPPVARDTARAACPAVVPKPVAMAGRIGWSDHSWAKVATAAATSAMTVRR